MSTTLQPHLGTYCDDSMCKSGTLTCQESILVGDGVEGVVVVARLGLALVIGTPNLVTRSTMRIHL